MGFVKTLGEAAENYRETEFVPYAFMKIDAL